jgi:hypothetical protein
MDGAAVFTGAPDPVVVVAVVVSWVAAEPVVAAVAANTPAAATTARADHRHKGLSVLVIVDASSCLGPSA